ncbi:MAG TPA: amino acid adenylation domain-containing protein [Jatrophihabitans sp.]|nr:amino acid adenylation domain-containing protein [Jatrophihabitans sp.]
MSGRPFDLAAGPVWRAYLLRVAAGDHLLGFTAHHIVMDAWSAKVFVDEVSECYRAAREGRPAGLPELPVQYSELARRQRESLSDAEVRRQLAHWRHTLADLEPLELPTDHPRSAGMSTDGGVAEFRIPPDTVAGLRALARQHRSTPFLVLLSALQVLLGRHAGRTDFALGMPIENRDAAEAELLIGFFVNTLVQRADLSGDPTFRQLLERNRETALDSYDYRDVPFERVVAELRPDRDQAGSPLFQVMMVMNTAFGRFELPGLDIRPYPVEPPQQAKYELTAAFLDDEDGLRGELRYQAALFGADRMERLADQLVRLLAEVAADPDRPVSALPLLAPAEHRRLIEEWALGAPAPEPCPLHELVERQARLRPGAPAATGPDGGTIGYAELNARANRLARLLVRAGAGVECPVAVCLPRSPDWLVAVLAVLKAGAVYVPIDPDYPVRRQAMLLAEAGVRLALAEDDELAGFAGVVLGRSGRRAADAEPATDLALPVPLDAAAYVVFTSGSTGRPKGVVASHRNASLRIRTLVADYRFGPGDVTVAMAATGFDSSVREIFTALAAGARLVLAPPSLTREPAAVLDLLARERVTAIASIVPSVLYPLAAGPVPPDGLAAVRLVLCSGERLRPERLAGSGWLDGVVVNQFGPTETTMTATRRRIPAGVGRESGYDVGTPVAGTSCYVLGPDLSACPPGVPGELYLGGAGVARGYLGRPALTAERFVPNPFGTGRLYRTGDRCRWSADGTLEHLGRIDHQLKIRGIRVEPGEIEATLRGLDGIRDAVVTASEPAPGEVRLTGYLVFEDGCQPTAGALRAGLEGTLPPYLVPSTWVVLPRLPLTPNGKVDRAALPSPDPDEPGLAERYVAPRTELERTVAAAWQDVLGRQRIGVHDNFFDLGGHSLLATQVVSRIGQVTGAQIPLRLLFEAPTVAGLSGRLVEPRTTGEHTAIPRADRQQPLLPSFAQQRLWFLEQLNPGTNDYVIPIGWRLTGELDVAALRQALTLVVERHEVLRTTFAAVDGEPRQLIADPAPASLPLRESTEAGLGPLLRQVVGEPFDLARGPLWRAVLVRLGPAEHVFALVLHHIVADAWSAGVLLRELGAGYRAALAGQPAELAELGVQYADFAAWQQRWLTGEVLQRQLDYWRRILAGAVPAELPTDRPRGAVRDPAGGHVDFEIGPELTEAIRELARQRQVTLFTVLLAAVQVLLGRYSGQQDIVVGTPIANRNRPEVEPLIGFFVNTLVLRGDLSGNPTVSQLLARARETTLGAYEHQDLPFERLVEELQPDRDLSRTPLFETLLSVDNTATAELSLPGVGLDDYPLAADRARFDLTLAFFERPDRLHASVRFSTALFDADRMHRLTGHLTRLLAGMVADPECRLSELPLLTGPERQQLRDFETGPVGQPETGPGRPEVLRLIERVAARQPDALAVRAVGGPETEPSNAELSYAELDRRANRLANHLRALGVGPEQVVGLCLDRRPDVVVAALAVWKAGAAYLPLEPGHPAERIGFQLADAASRLLIVAGGVPAGLRFDGQLVDLADPATERAVAGGAAAAPRLTTHPDSLAYVMHTSGSTGRPKGVQVTHRGLANYLAWAREHYPLRRSGGALLHSSLAFDMTVTSLFLPLLAGSTVTLLRDGTDPAAILATAEHGAASLLKLTPTHLRMLAEAAAGDRPFPPMVVVGGESLSVPVARAVLAQLPADGMLVNEYGPTETVVGCSVYVRTAEQEPASAADGSVPIGRPIANTQLYVLDSGLEPCPIGVPGQLFIGGAGLARGYAGRPALTAERFVPNPFGPGRLYRTGDVVSWSADGQLHYLGRADSQVKVRGYRIELGEIEERLRALPGVAQAAVLARPDAAGDRRLVAYLVPAGAGLSVTGVRAALARELPSYLVPSAFLTLAALPLSGSGKLDAAALPEPDGSQRQLAAEPVRPRTDAEALIAGVWQDVLGLAEVGVLDDFFALGGHSLLATRVVSRLAARLERPVLLRLLFENPTVAGLATVLDGAPAERGAPAAPIVPVPRTGAMPLSFAQQRLWFLDQLDPGSAEYAVPLAWRFTGLLDVPALRTALDRVVARHEVLRTTIRAADGKAFQQITADGPVEFTVREVGPADVAGLVADFIRRPFQLDAGPLWRVLLLRTGPAEHVLTFAMHHIVADAWSAGVLLAELSEHYRAALTGVPSRLPELAVQYADYASWQRDRMAGPVLAAELDYWRAALAGAEPLVLPTDRPRPSVRSTAGATVTFELPAEATARLRALAGAEACTLFMVVLAALQTLLARYSGQQDIAIGTPIANRNRAEIEPLIGFFVNTLVLRGDLSGDPTFTELLQRARRVTLAAYEHQDLPFERLVDELGLHRDLSSTPLFTTMLSVDNTAPARWELPGLASEQVPLDSQQAKFDLTVAVGVDGDRLTGAIRYSTALFDADRVERMAAHLCRLLTAAGAAPHTRLSELPLLTERERQLVLPAGPRQPAPPGGRLLHLLVERWARTTPDRAAVTDTDGRTVSYAELNARANRLAHHLIRHGAGPERLVGVCMHRSVNTVVSLLAVLKAGAAYLPLDPDYPADRQAFILADAAAGIVLTDLGVAAELTGLVVDLADPATLDRLAAEPATDPAVGLRDDNTAYVIYTSGSTGRPKGVQVTHANACRLFEVTAATYGFDPDQVWLCTHSYAFDFSVWEIWGALTTGARVVVASHQVARDPRRLAEVMRAERVSMLSQTPTAFRALLPELLRVKPAGLRYVVFGGEALDVTAVRPWFAEPGVAGTLVNMYGITETTVHVTWKVIGAGTAGDAAVSPIGRPLADLRAYVLDRQLAPVPLGVPGEVYVGGAGLSRGYLGRPGLTADRFLPDPFGGSPGGRLYRTGDLAQWTAGGELQYLGRSDHQVKIRGFRIELGEIEARLNEHPEVTEAVVLAREDEPGERRLVGYWVPAAGSQPSVSGLRSWLERTLPGYMVPSAWVQLPSLPLTASGKLDRAVLPAPGTARPELGARFAAPRSAAESVLVGIWAQVLGLDRVGIHDNFFDLGGDSILSIQIVARAVAAGLVLTPRMVFEHQTVAEMAANAERRAAVPAGPVAEPTEAPLTPIQQWFFGRTLPRRDHYNQSMLLTAPADLDGAGVTRLLTELAARHDALRLRFRAGPAGWRQELAEPVPVPVPVRVLDLSAAGDRRAELLAEAAEELQAGLDIGSGRVFAGLLAELGAAGRQLLLVAHHLVMDGVSWRILLDDLQAGYRGQPVPPASTSYLRWARLLAEHAGSPAAAAELPYWQRVGRAGAGLRRDLPAAADRNTLDSAAEIQVRFSAEGTRALLQDVAATFRTRINDVLLTALAGALRPVVTGDAVVVDVEGHGREDLFEGVDLSRTVGWFTTVYPVRLQAGAGWSLPELLKDTKQRLREVPDGGIGYGVLRQLGPPEVAATLPGGEVLFNYLGQFDNVLAGDRPFAGAAGSRGSNQAAVGLRSHLLEINCEISDGRFAARFSYSRNVHRPDTVQRIADEFIGQLEAIVRAGGSGDQVVAAVPADFPLVGLDQEALDALLGEYGRNS